MNSLRAACILFGSESIIAARHFAIGEIRVQILAEARKLSDKFCLTNLYIWDIIYYCRMGPQWFRRGFCDTISVAGRIIPINCPTLKNKRQQNCCSGCLIRQCCKTAVLPVALGVPRPRPQRHEAVTVHRCFAIEPIMHKMATLTRSLSADAAEGEF